MFGVRYAVALVTLRSLPKQLEEQRNKAISVACPPSCRANRRRSRLGLARRGSHASTSAPR